MEEPWNAKHDTGIGLIDEQHREIFSAVGELRTLVREGSDRARIVRVLDRLIEASSRHFESEEAIMAQFGFPDLPRHAAEHASMLAGLQELQDRFRGDAQALALLVPTFMEGWLRHHISDGDFGFLTFLKARSLV